MKLNKRRALDRRQMERRQTERPGAPERRQETLPPGHTHEDVNASLHGRATVVADCSVGTSTMRQVVRRIGDLYRISFYTTQGMKR